MCKLHEVTNYCSAEGLHNAAMLNGNKVTGQDGLQTSEVMD